MLGNISIIKAAALLMKRCDFFFFKINTMIEQLINYGCFIKYQLFYPSK